MTRFTRGDAELLRDLLVRCTGSWSANAIVKMMQTMDLGIRRQDALALIRGWVGAGDRRGRPRSQMALSELLSEPLSEPIREPLTEPVAEPLTGQNHKGIVYIASWLRHSGLSVTSFPASPNHAGAHEENGPEELAWIRELRREYEPIAETPLQRLKVDQRVVLGRVHALLFANFRIDQTANKAKGVIIAGQLARMSVAQRFQGLTCDQYLRFGVKTLEKRNGRPFHSAFDIEAAIEYETQ